MATYERPLFWIAIVAAAACRSGLAAEPIRIFDGFEPDEAVHLDDLAMFKIE